MVGKVDTGGKLGAFLASLLMILVMIFSKCPGKPIYAVP
jgi:hypothetical protein